MMERGGEGEKKTKNILPQRQEEHKKEKKRGKNFTQIKRKKKEHR